MALTALFRPHRRAQEARLAHALRSVPLFRDLPAAELVAIWRRLSHVQVPAGTVLCRRGEPGDRFFVIQSGSLEVHLGLGPAGVGLCRLGPGDFVGELALLMGQPRSADVVAVEDAVVWVLDRAAFDDILAHSVPLLRALNRALGERLAVMNLILEEREAGTRMGVAGLRFGPYRVIEQIGTGGMAVVYSAAHVVTEAVVALKVLPVGWGLAPEYQARLRREVAVLQQIDHPNVINVLDVGEVEAGAGGGCYLAMEWLPYGLDRMLRAQYPEPLSPITALRLAQAVAEGLAAVHEAGLVHRDVKPSNILMRADGSPVLIDFGLVDVLAEIAHRERLTPSNVIVGTADYLAPERVVGAPIDGRSDIYALGVVLYEMLAGYVPFAGHDPLATLQAHVEAAVPPLPSGVPPAAQAIVERALQKRPEDRFPSATAMVSALHAARMHITPAP